MSRPLALPPAEAVLLRTRAEALAALAAVGWKRWSASAGLDAERRRLLNVDLSEPDVAWMDEAGAPAAVAHLELDGDGQVVVLEVTAAEPLPAHAAADALFPGAAEPRVGGGAEAREWVWGPEAGHDLAVGGEPVRLWACAERAYGDRLWAVLSVVRRV